MDAKLFWMLILSIALWSFSPLSCKENSEAVSLNSAGVKALTKSNFKLAFENFHEALNIDPKYEQARKNLSIAHNNFAMYVAGYKKNLDAALKHYHRAIFLDENNLAAKGNLNLLIREMGKNPDNFEDRVKLGDTALEGSDFPGAVVEYKAALGIQKEAGIQKKLDNLKKKLETSPKFIPGDTHKNSY